MAATAPVGGEKLRLGFSFSMFKGVNENDARASIKALAATVARERGIPADPEPLLFGGADEIIAAVRAGRVDAVGMTTSEFRIAAGEVEFDRFMMAASNGDPAEQYLVLAHRKRAIAGLAALRGGRLAVFTNSRMSLARAWLEVQLAQAGLPVAGEHFSQLVDHAKLSKSVLEVFFQQADACLVTRRGFATMVEMNPQIGRELTAVLASSALVPALFGFRAGFSPELKERSVREFTLVHQSTAGQQALVIFQTDRVIECSRDTLTSALALLDDYARLRPEASAAYLQAIRNPVAPPAGRKP